MPGVLAAGAGMIAVGMAKLRPTDTCCGGGHRSVSILLVRPQDMAAVAPGWRVTHSREEDCRTG